MHSVDRFVIVSIFIPKLRLILILNSFLGSSDSLVFSELFHSLAPRPLAARSISDFRSEERFSRNAETDLVCRLLLEQDSHEKSGQYRIVRRRHVSVLCWFECYRHHRDLRSFPTRRSSDLICHCEHFHPEVAAHSDSEQLLGK